MTKHTQGPWYFEPTRRPNGGFNIVQDRPSGVVVVKPGDEYNCYGNIDNEADAKLIAAAPDLLEALRELDECYCEAGNDLSKEDRHRHRMTLIKARAAIEKATKTS